MISKTKFNNEIGKIYGKYKILEDTGKRTKDRAIIYKVQCIKCGWINEDGKTLYEIKKTNPNSICNHKINPYTRIGQIHGKYKLLNVLGNDGNGHWIYKVQCLKCGYIEEKGMTFNDITRYGENSRCQHNFWKSKNLMTIYYHMYQRCYDINEKYYDIYGGRGIKICDEWLNKPWKFQEWAYNNGYQEGLTIDRKDNNSDYCPENCMWTDKSTNSKFKRSTNYISVNGILDSASGWEKRLNLRNGCILNYLNKYGYITTAEYIANIICKQNNLINVITIIDETTFDNKIRS